MLELQLPTRHEWIQSDTTYGKLAIEAFEPGFALTVGIAYRRVLLSAILAAIMSTLSCQLLVCSSALTEDFYRGFVRPSASQRELVWFGRAMVLAVALLAIWLARNPDSSVLKLVAYAWAGFGAAFGPVVLFSLGWARMTRNGALAGMLVGGLTVILWKQGSGGIFALYEMVPGVVLSAIAIWVVSSLGNRGHSPISSPK